jgi:LysM repeat protein
MKEIWKEGEFVMIKLNGVDCVTRIDHQLAAGLKSAGIEYVGRYLGDNWKSISKKEAETLINAGLKIVSIWETNPTNARYFTEKKGIADGNDATSYAKSIGQPEGSAIYFAVDYDAQPSDMDSILRYFFGVRRGLGKNYKAGVYGSYPVLELLNRSCAVDCFWQTAAWSRGKVADFIDIFQYGFNKKLVGIPVDYNQFSNSAGSWGKETESSFTGAPSPVATANTYTVQSGDTLSRIAARFGTTVVDLVNANHIKDPNLIYSGQNLTIPSAKTIGSSGRMEYTVKPGDTLSKIAVEFGTTVNQLQAWNRITNPNLIRVGQKIMVK